MASERKPRFPKAIPNPAGKTLEKPQLEKLVSNNQALIEPPEILDLGILTPLLQDPDITEIMVNDVRNVMVEIKGRIANTSIRFQRNEEIHALIRTMIGDRQILIDDYHPYANFSLSDGSRVNIVHPPVTEKGPCITIRKFPKRLSAQDLTESKFWDERIATFLHSCVVGNLNILISGGTGSGKTSLMNVLANMIPKSERILTIEDTPELHLLQKNTVQMITQPPSPSHSGITARDLMTNSLRMRPDRIIIGECRSDEALDMLQAMNTGHDGSMTTIHANAARESISRLETLCMMTGVEIPLRAIRRQIVNAIDLVVQVSRFRNGYRRIVSIQEVVGMEGEIVTMQELFHYQYHPVSPDGARHGTFKSLGLIPSFTEKLKEQGIQFPPSFFS